MNLKKLFLDHCEIKQYEINQNQLDLINYLQDYYKNNFNHECNFTDEFIINSWSSISK